MWWNVYTEAAGGGEDEPTPVRLQERQIDEVLDALEDYSPAIAMTEAGWLGIRLSIQARNLRQASDLTYLVIHDALVRAGIAGRQITTEILPEQEFFRRGAADQVWPDIISTAEAAHILGMTPQGVAGYAERLGAKKVGNTMLYLRSSVERLADQLAAQRGARGI